MCPTQEQPDPLHRVPSGQQVLHGQERAPNKRHGFSPMDPSFIVWLHESPCLRERD